MTIAADDAVDARRNCNIEKLVINTNLPAKQHRHKDVGVKHDAHVLLSLPALLLEHPLL